MKKKYIIPAKMNKVEAVDLNNIADETMVTGFDHFKDKLFTAANLWNIQRQGKSRVQRRVFL